jgi:succinoglycan biosynthesis protein ExoU
VSNEVSVIIPAWQCQSTIARAIASALAEPEAAEVIVIDDASGDGTVAEARGADDGSGRLKIVEQPRNCGPAAARNRGIALSRAPLIALLDSDDFFLAGRFAALLDVPDWDLIADNIMFAPESLTENINPPRAVPIHPEPVGLAEFIEANISRPGRSRGELGFAKPVMRRSCLERVGGRYDERLRLGEDYALYVRLLAAGGRFVRVHSCFYVATERPSSLSGRHQTADLAALLAFDREFMASNPVEAPARAALQRHIAQLEARLHHREILDQRQLHGRVAAVRAAAARPKLLPGLVGSVLRDKLGRDPASGVRYLFA